MQDNYRQIWERIAEAIKPQVNTDTYQRWFADITLIGADEQRMTLRVPNNIYQLWIESNYMPIVQSAIMRCWAPRGRFVSPPQRATRQRVVRRACPWTGQLLER